MVPGIDPTVDFAFKLVFGSPDHPQVTIHFLNSVLNFRQPVTEVEFLNPIQGREHLEDKLSILDVLASDRDGRQYNIEMQTTLPMDLPRRLAYYNCLNYVRQIGVGQRYLDLRPAVSICVLGRVLFGEVADHHLSFRLRCDQQPLVFTDDLEFHTLELPKFEPGNRQIEQLSRLEKWLYLLKNAPHVDSEDLARMLGEPEYAEAIGILTMISKTPEDRQIYEARMKFLNDHEARMTAAENKGAVRGREEGREEGLIAGKIQLLQQLLGNEELSMEALSSRSLSDYQRCRSSFRNACEAATPDQIALQPSAVLEASF